MYEHTKSQFPESEDSSIIQIFLCQRYKYVFKMYGHCGYIVIIVQKILFVIIPSLSLIVIVWNLDIFIFALQFADI